MGRNVNSCCKASIMREPFLLILDVKRSTDQSEVIRCVRKIL